MEAGWRARPKTLSDHGNRAWHSTSTATTPREVTRRSCEGMERTARQHSAYSGVARTSTAQRPRAIDHLGRELRNPTVSTLGFAGEIARLPTSACRGPRLVYSGIDPRNYLCEHVWVSRSMSPGYSPQLSSCSALPHLQTPRPHADDGTVRLTFPSRRDSYIREP
jgi:hypothetical protein